ncbi:hypothetical protein EDB84DRAFT_1674989 [Lactarius hengduanensis]|nr:hypothetical protein EDB84DRAFT_1674989 [Lactarius hengduanensis]
MFNGNDEACEASLGPEATSFTDAQKAEPPKHGNAFGGKQYGCGPCKMTFKRLQDIMRHVRDIHDPPRQCPLCHYQWTRAYKIKAHLLKAHSDELCPAVTAGIHDLRGHDMVKFIDTYELLRSFETPDIVKSLSKSIGAYITLKGARRSGGGDMWRLVKKSSRGVRWRSLIDSGRVVAVDKRVIILPGSFNRLSIMAMVLTIVPTPLQTYPLLQILKDLSRSGLEKSTKVMGWSKMSAHTPQILTLQILESIDGGDRVGDNNLTKDHGEVTKRDPIRQTPFRTAK